MHILNNLFTPDVISEAGRENNALNFILSGYAKTN